MSQPPLDPDRLQRIATAMDAAVEAGHAPGLVARVMVGDETVFEHATGKASEERPASFDTIYRIASMTKAITSVALLRLLEHGAPCLLGDPLEWHLPEFANMTVLVLDESAENGWTTRPARGSIKVHHLLTHTSGLIYAFAPILGDPNPAVPVLAQIYRDSGVQDLPPHNQSLEEHLRKLAALPLLFDPGTDWFYSLGTDVVGRLVEVLSGQPLFEHLQEHILDPLGMRDTRYTVLEADAERLATMYGMQALPVAEGEPPRYGFAEVPQEMHTTLCLSFDPRAHEPKPPGTQLYYSGGGGLASTVGDYCRFLRMLAGGGELDGVRILSPATIRFMNQNHIGKLDGNILSGWKHGLATAVCPAEGALTIQGIPGQCRWSGVFGTAYLYDVERNVVAVLMQQGWPRGMQDFQRRFYAVLNQAFN